MWTDNKVSPAKYVSFVMLIIYMGIALFLFAKIRNLVVSTTEKSFVGSEEKTKETAGKTKPEDDQKEAVELADRYVKNLAKEIESDSERQNSKRVFYMQPVQYDILSEIMKLDGRLAMAPTVEPYFARR